MINYQKVKIKNNIKRGSLLSVPDVDYKKFIIKSKELTIVKINNDRILLQNEFQENNWFYISQLERII
jgi:hypothetical protein